MGYGSSALFIDKNSDIQTKTDPHEKHRDTQYKNKKLVKNNATGDVLYLPNS